MPVEDLLPLAGEELRDLLDVLVATARQALYARTKHRQLFPDDKTEVQAEIRTMTTFASLGRGTSTQVLFAMRDSYSARSASCQCFASGDDIASL